MTTSRISSCIWASSSSEMRQRKRPRCEAFARYVHHVLGKLRKQKVKQLTVNWIRESYIVDDMSTAIFVVFSVLYMYFY